MCDFLFSFVCVVSLRKTAAIGSVLGNVECIEDEVKRCVSHHDAALKALHCGDRVFPVEDAIQDGACRMITQMD